MGGVLETVTADTYQFLGGVERDLRRRPSRLQWCSSAKRDFRYRSMIYGPSATIVTTLRRSRLTAQRFRVFEWMVGHRELRSPTPRVVDKAALFPKIESTCSGRRPVISETLSQACLRRYWRSTRTGTGFTGRIVRHSDKGKPNSARKPRPVQLA